MDKFFNLLVFILIDFSLCSNVCEPCFCIPSKQPEVMICETKSAYEYPKYITRTVKNNLKEIYIRNSTIVCLPDILNGEYNSLRLLKERHNYFLSCPCIMKWQENLPENCLIDTICIPPHTLTTSQNDMVQTTKDYIVNYTSEKITTDHSITFSTGIIEINSSKITFETTIISEASSNYPVTPNPHYKPGLLIAVVLMASVLITIPITLLCRCLFRHVLRNKRVRIIEAQDAWAGLSNTIYMEDNAVEMSVMSQ